MVSILHITVHMGAGAGKAISGIAIKDAKNDHKIIVLQQPEKKEHIIRCCDHGISIIIEPDVKTIENLAKKADVIVISWWHHPLIYKVFRIISQINARIILWSHVNGLYYPTLYPSFLRLFDTCMFTSKASFNNPTWSDEDRKKMYENSYLVYGMGDFKPSEIEPKSNYDIAGKTVLGYVGTLDYSKLHPSFVEWLAEVLHYDDSILVKLVGDINSEIRDDVYRARLSERVEFMGFKTDVLDILGDFDIFIYPLNPVNYATTENALLEAMAKGLPIVTSDGIVERSIVKHEVNGIMVHDKYEFSERIIQLMTDHNQRSRIGNRSREDVIREYSVDSNMVRFQHAIDETVKKDKDKHDFMSVIGKDPFSWFLSCCGTKEKEMITKAISCSRSDDDYEKVVGELGTLQNIYRAQSKGSVYHFGRTFTDDKKLRLVIQMMKEAEKQE